MTEIVKRPPTELATDDDDAFADQLVAGIVKHQMASPTTGGMPLLRLVKPQNWVFGQANDPVQPGSEWAINPRSLMHGYSCWTDYKDQKNTALGEIMVAMTDPLPPRPEAIQGFPFKDTVAFNLKCMNGEDEGTEVLYKNNSEGGKRATSALLAAINKQHKRNKAYIVPIVTLSSTTYNNAKWGVTLVPIIEIVAWANWQLEEEPAEGAEQPAAAAPTPAPEPAKPALTPRRPGAAAAPQPAPEPVQPTRAAPPRRQRPVTA